MKHPRLATLLRVLILAALLVACSKPLASNDKETQMPVDTVPLWVIAHRGARSLAPENTLLAARKAYDAGANGWELDVTMAADGQLVVIHDDTLERTSNATQVFPDRWPWRVEDFTLDELLRLDFGSWFVHEDPFEQIAAGAVTPGEQAAMTGAKIPTLRETLEFTRDHDWWVNVEIKDASGTPADAVIVQRVVALIKELGMSDQVLISSFNHDYLRQVKALQPQLATGALSKDFIADPLSLLIELDAQAYHPSLKIVNAEQVHLLRQNGYAVYVWTVNEDADIRALIEMGVSGIFTDFPQRVSGIK